METTRRLRSAGSPSRGTLASNHHSSRSQASLSRTPLFAGRRRPLPYSSVGLAQAVARCRLRLQRHSPQRPPPTTKRPTVAWPSKAPPGWGG